MNILNEAPEAETVIASQSGTPVEAPEAETVITSQSGTQDEAEARTEGSDTSPAEEPPVTKRNGKANGTRSRKSAAEAIIAAESLLQPVDGSPASSNGTDA